MKKWERILLFVLAMALLAGAVTGTLATAQEACPKQQVFSWWSTLYPTVQEEDRPCEIKLYSAELWQKLRTWWENRR